jgi:hypothetical protein
LTLRDVRICEVGYSGPIIVRGIHGVHVWMGEYT